ncbi:MAG: transglycosylase domain-containing protein [Anaerolineales bacterium]|nr:transglycosylase domain-containing protein [Anaerolineales bacterium]
MPNKYLPDDYFPEETPPEKRPEEEPNPSDSSPSAPQESSNRPSILKRFLAPEEPPAWNDFTATFPTASSPDPAAASPASEQPPAWNDFTATFPAASNDLSQVPAHSQTILPDGARSGRPSPPPLYPEPNFPPVEPVEAIDLNATRVTPAALQSATGPRRPVVASRRTAPVGQSTQPRVRRPPWGCLMRGLVIGLFVFVGALIVGSIAAVAAYLSIAADLPTVDDLRARSSQFETTRILDRNGNSLYEILDPSAGRRTTVKLNQISPYVVAATIATEDKEFYNHPGFDPLAILRALWANLQTGGEGGGASTITQQLARALLLSPEERNQRTYLRKVREIILAAEITRRYSKDEILELYLNEIYYGNLAYGIEAAAETYFGPAIDGQLTGTPNGLLADDLNLAQASFLAGLPQSPAVYDIHTNRLATLTRHRDVIVLMYQLSAEKGCIQVSNSPQPVCVGVQESLQAAQDIENFKFPAPNIQMRYPHWVQYIRAQLESKYDAQTIYRSGFTVYTTLDPALQDLAQELVTNQVNTLFSQGRNVKNGALVAIQPQSGEILVMVGSPDFYNEAIDGQVNMAVSPTRQPGSSIKPLTYVAAFEKGWTASTLIWDVPTGFPPSGDPNDPREPYVPRNYDGKFHGPVTVRSALANSYNIPAVRALYEVGIYDDPNTPAKEGLIGMAQKLGITSLTRNDYGLALTLGGGEVSLLEMTSAFAVFANNGVRVPPVSILKVVDSDGNVVEQYTPPPGEQVIRPEHAFLISSILSDNEARRPMFGSNSALNLPFPAAAKTGTTNDFRDNWTIGYTPDLAAGVWVGNADYTPMQNTTGLTGAAPIWSQFMLQAVPRITGGNPSPFVRPAGIVDKVICAISGTEPSQWCPQQRSELFAADQPPLPATEDLWKEVIIDTWSGQIANNSCRDFVQKKMTLNVTDPNARFWLRKTDEGRAWAEQMGFEPPLFFTPQDECNANTPRATLSIENLRDGQTLTESAIDVEIIADATDGFTTWRLEYAEGDNPREDAWQLLIQSDQRVPGRMKVVTWDLEKTGNGRFSLRLRIENQEGGYAERVIRIQIEYTPPIPTPIPPTETPTALPPTPSATPEPPTPEPTATP